MQPAWLFLFWSFFAAWRLRGLAWKAIGSAPPQSDPCGTLMDSAAKGKNSSHSLDQEHAKSCQTAPKEGAIASLAVISGHFPAFSSKTRMRRVE